MFENYQGDNIMNFAPLRPKSLDAQQILNNIFGNPQAAAASAAGQKKKLVVATIDSDRRVRAEVKNDAESAEYRGQLEGYQGENAEVVTAKNVASFNVAMAKLLDSQEDNNVNLIVLASRKVALANKEDIQTIVDSKKVAGSVVALRTGVRNYIQVQNLITATEASVKESKDSAQQLRTMFENIDQLFSA